MSISADIVAWLKSKLATLGADVSAIPTNPMLDTEDGSSFGAIPDMAKDSTVMKAASYTAPDNSNIEKIVNQTSRINATLALPAVYTKTVTIPIIGSAADQSLGTLTIAGLPNGAVISHLFIHFLFAERSDTSGVTNSLSGTQNLQVKKNDGGYSTFFSFGGGEYSTVANTQASGDAKKGTVDLAALAPVNTDVLTFKWTAAGAVGASLVFSEFEIICELQYTLGS